MKNSVDLEWNESFVLCQLNILFSCVHATLQPAMSVGRSVGRSVGWSVGHTLLFL